MYCDFLAAFVGRLMDEGRLPQAVAAPCGHIVVPATSAVIVLLFFVHPSGQNAITKLTALAASRITAFYSKEGWSMTNLRWPSRQDGNLCNAILEVHPGMVAPAVPEFARASHTKPFSLAYPELGDGSPDVYHLLRGDCNSHSKLQQ